MIAGILRAPRRAVQLLVHLPARWKTRHPKPPRPAPAGVLGRSRKFALVVIAALVGAASLASFSESYRALYDWAAGHGLSGLWASVWPLQVDVFIAVGELALFVGLADAWSRRSRIGAWAVTLTGLAVSVAGNVGHVANHVRADRVTAAVPPLAAAAALAVGLGVLKRVVEHHQQEVPETGSDPVPGEVPSDRIAAAKVWYAETVRVGNPAAVTKVQGKFSLTRREATEICTPAIPPTVTLPDPGHTLNGNGPHE